MSFCLVAGSEHRPYGVSWGGSQSPAAAPGPRILCLHGQSRPASRLVLVSLSTGSEPVSTLPQGTGLWPSNVFLQFIHAPTRKKIFFWLISCFLKWIVWRLEKNASSLRTSKENTTFYVWSLNGEHLIMHHKHKGWKSKQVGWFCMMATKSSC